jgi:hypothetical protein
MVGVVGSNPIAPTNLNKELLFSRLDENVFDQIAGSDLEQRSEATLARRAEGRTM